MAESVNSSLRDAAVSHMIDHQHYSNHVVYRLIALLNRLDGEIAAEIILAIEKMQPESFNVDRLDQLLQGVRSLNTQAYYAVEKELTAELHAFVEYEAGYQHQLFTSVIPPQIIARVTIAAINVEAVYASALSRPFMGILLKEALYGLEVGRAKAIRDAIRIGFVESRTTSDIVKTIRGTRAMKYADGLMNAPRQHVEAITRTALSHTAGFVRDRFYEANNVLIKAQLWVSTIDARTTIEFCIPRDGLQYTNDTHEPIGHKYPWLSGPGRLHYCCRSVSTPITRSAKELGGADIPSFEPSVRASMDGTLPAETTYAEWIKKQSAERQDQVLGATRGKLLRNGGMTIDKFYNDRGRLLNLDALRERDAAAFARAGV